MTEYNVKTSALVFLVITLGIWLTAMLTVEWLILAVNNCSQAAIPEWQKLSRRFTYLGIFPLPLGFGLLQCLHRDGLKMYIDSIFRTVDCKMSLFRYEYYLDKMSVSGWNKDLSIPEEWQGMLYELQLWSIVAVALCGLCCILVICTKSSTYNKKPIALNIIVLSASAVLVEVSLLIRFYTQMKNQLHDNSFDAWKFNSAGLALVGCVTGTFGWVLNLMYYSSLKWSIDI